MWEPAFCAGFQAPGKGRPSGWELPRFPPGRVISIAKPEDSAHFRQNLPSTTVRHRKSLFLETRVNCVLLQILVQSRFSFTPGTRFSYSGIGFLFLQQIVEKVTRLSFEQYLETAIFKPLHMTSTSFVWRDDYDTRKANGHDNIGRPTAIRKPMVPKAPSSLHTSAADYARFLAAVLGRSGLSASRWKAMVTPQIPVQQDCVVCISKAAGQLSSAVECKRVRKYTVDEILDSL